MRYPPVGVAGASVVTVIPVSAPPRLAAHLRATGDGPVPLVHRGPDAVYVDVAGRCVGVVGTRATAVPCALRTTLTLLPEVVRAVLTESITDRTAIKRRIRTWRPDYDRC